MSKEIAKEIKMFAESVHHSKNILDVGCGLKPYEQFFNNCDYIGIDVEKSGRNEDEKRPDKFYDGLNIPFEDKSFDIAICTEVLEHCIDPERLLSEIYRILKKDGVLFFTMPFMWGEHEVPYDFRRYSSYGIKQKIENIGFKTIKQEKLVKGVQAVEHLVGSEINSWKHKHSKKSGLGRQVKEFILYYMWRGVIRLWDSLYSFDRIYIYNLIIAKK